MTKTALTVSAVLLVLLLAALFIGLLPDRSPTDNWQNVNEEIATAAGTNVVTETKPKVEQEKQPDKEPEPGGSEKESEVGGSEPIGTASDGQLQKVDINLATAEEFDTLPGIGPAKAKAIIDYRMSYGPFKSLEQLMEVKGIGPKVFEKLKTEIIVSSSP